MTLETLLNIICDLAIKRNLVNYSAAGSSIYELNTKTVDSYPFIFVSPTGSIVTRKNFTDYGLTLFYVERLLEDNANDTRTYSIANDTLVNLVRQLRQLTGIVEITEPSVRLFNDERLNDRCCGAYAEITVTVLNEAECPVIFDEEGEFMGTYIPETLKEVDILDSLASKDWVARYVAEHSGGGGCSGMTEEEVRRLINDALRAYTKTNKFATINGSGITDNEAYSLLTSAEFEAFLTGYTQEIQNIWNSMTSGGTPADYNQVKAQVTANTENISVLSAFTSGLSFTVSENAQNIEQIESAITGINETISVLSAQTSANTAQILALSGYTEQAVSSFTQEFESVYTAISAATPADYEQLKGQVTANTENIVILSGMTSGLSADLVALSAYTATITGSSDWVFFVSGNTVPYEATNSDDLIDYLQSLGSEFNKARVFINEGQSDRYVEYRPFRMAGDTVYLYVIYNTNNEKIKLRQGSYTKGVTPSQSDWSYYELPMTIGGTVTDISNQTTANTASITALTTDLAALSAFTETLSGDTSETAYIDLSDGSTGAQVYAKIDSAYTAGKQIILRAIDYTAKSSRIHILLPFSRKEGNDYRFQGTWVQEGTSRGIQTYSVKITSSGTAEGTISNSGVIYAFRDVFSKYSLPTASASTKGGVKVGTGLSMNGDVMSADVASSDIHNIVSLTQSDYDALTTKDANTLYIIKPL